MLMMRNVIEKDKLGMKPVEQEVVLREHLVILMTVLMIMDLPVNSLKIILNILRIIALPFLNVDGEERVIGMNPRRPGGRLHSVVIDGLLHLILVGMIPATRGIRDALIDITVEDIGDLLVQPEMS